jgi:hypothetical protein
VAKKDHPNAVERIGTGHLNTCAHLNGDNDEFSRS